MYRLLFITIAKYDLAMDFELLFNVDPSTYFCDVLFKWSVNVGRVMLESIFDVVRRMEDVNISHGLMKNILGSHI